MQRRGAHVVADEDDEVRVVDGAVDVVAVADRRGAHVHAMPCAGTAAAGSPLCMCRHWRVAVQASEGIAELAVAHVV